MAFLGKRYTYKRRRLNSAIGNIIMARIDLVELTGRMVFACLRDESHGREVGRELGYEPFMLQHLVTAIGRTHSGDHLLRHPRRLSVPMSLASNDLQLEARPAKAQFRIRPISPRQRRLFAAKRAPAIIADGSQRIQ